MQSNVETIAVTSMLNSVCCSKHQMGKRETINIANICASAPDMGFTSSCNLKVLILKEKASALFCAGWSLQFVVS